MNQSASADSIAEPRRYTLHREKKVFQGKERVKEEEECKESGDTVMQRPRQTPKSNTGHSLSINNIITANAKAAVCTGQHYQRITSCCREVKVQSW